MKLFHLILFTVMLVFCGCNAIQKTLDTSHPYKVRRSVWAGIRGSYDSSGSYESYFSKITEYLSQVGSEKFDAIHDHPPAMARVEVDISFDSNKKIIIKKVDGMVSSEIKDAAREAVTEAYTSMTFTPEAYLNFSKINQIFFIFNS